MLKKVFSPLEWKHAICFSFKATHFMNHWEISLKIDYRSYSTPYTLSTIFTDASPLCWYQCGSAGNLLHILWDCKSVRSFWNAAFSLINTVIGILVFPFRHIALLNLTWTFFPVQFSTIISDTNNCKVTIAPNLSEVLQRGSAQCLYERFFAYNKVYWWRSKKV